MAVGDITRVWSAAAEVAWSSGGPASLADAAFTGLTDEVDADAGGAKVLDIQVAAKVTTASGVAGHPGARRDLGGDAGRRQQLWRQRQLGPRRRVLRAARGERSLLAQIQPRRGVRRRLAEAVQAGLGEPHRPCSRRRCRRHRGLHHAPARQRPGQLDGRDHQPVPVADEAATGAAAVRRSRASFGPASGRLLAHERWPRRRGARRRPA